MFVVVVVADREIEENNDHTDVKIFRFLLDFLDEVHHEPNEHSNRILHDAFLLNVFLPLLHQTNNLIVVVDSYDVDTMVDEYNDNLNTDNIHNNFDVHKAILFVDNSNDIHVLLLYEFVRSHFVDDDHVDKEMTIDQLDSMLGYSTTLVSISC